MTKVLLNSGWLILLTTHRDIIIYLVVCIPQHPSGCPEYCLWILHYTAFRWSCKPWEGEYNTYWPAGGGRGQNPSRTGLAQGLDLYLKYGPRALRSECYTSLGRLTWRTDSGRCAPLVRPPGQPPLGRIAFWPECPWAVFSGFCPRPPPAGQYVLIYPSHGYTALVEDEICKKYQAILASWSSLGTYRCM